MCDMPLLDRSGVCTALSVCGSIVLLLCIVPVHLTDCVCCVLVPSHWQYNFESGRYGRKSDAVLSKSRHYRPYLSAFASAQLVLWVLRCRFLSVSSYQIHAFWLSDAGVFSQQYELSWNLQHNQSLSSILVDDSELGSAQHSRLFSLSALLLTFRHCSKALPKTVLSSANQV